MLITKKEAKMHKKFIILIFLILTFLFIKEVYAQRVTIDYPRDGETVYSQDIYIYGIYSDAAVVYVNINGQGDVEANLIDKSNWDFNGVLQEGENVISARSCKEAGGDICSPEVRITVVYEVQTSTTITIDSPTNYAVVYAPTILASGSYTNADAVEIRVNGQTWKLADRFGGGRWDGNINLNPGSNTIEARALLGGIVYATASITVTYQPSTCAIRTSCLSYETSVLTLYQTTDSHVNKCPLTSSGGQSNPGGGSCIGANYQLCCYNFENKLVSTYSSSAGGRACGGRLTDDIVVRAYNNGVDAHVSKPESSSSNANTNICLTLTTGTSGIVQCRTSSSCRNDEISVMSLSQQEDSHVGAYNDYSNKICCKVVVCPLHFRWDGISCVPAFQICLLKFSNGTVSSRELCKDEWRIPVNQNDPYWRDAKIETQGKQNCFTPETNAEACCFDTTYSGNTYGSYSENVVIKRTIQEIQQQT